MPEAATGSETFDDAERLSAEALHTLQLTRLRASLQHAYDHVPFYRESFDRAGVHPRGLPLARRPRPLPVHRQGRSARPVPLRDVRRPQGAGAPAPRLQRHHGPPDGRRLHRARSVALGGCRRPLPPRGRRPARSHRAYRLRIRAVHRRAGRALRRGAARLHGRTGVRRDDQPAGADHPGLPARDHHGHAVLHAHPAGRVRAAGRRPPYDLAQGGRLRRRALDAGDAPRDRGAVRDRRRGHLRPVGGHGPGRRPGVCGDQGRAPHLGGPLLSGGGRPGHRRGAAGGCARRAGVHLPHQGGDAGHPLSHPGPDPAAARYRAGRLPPDGEDHRAQRRHDHSAGGQSLPRAGRGDRAADARASPRTSS